MKDKINSWIIRDIYFYKMREIIIMNKIVDTLSSQKVIYLYNLYNVSYILAIKNGVT